jgi:hypothetical protein
MCKLLGSISNIARKRGEEEEEGEEDLERN